MIACYYLGLRWIILIMQSYLLIFFTGFLVTFIYNNKKGRKKKKISFHISWLTLKDNKFPLKHPIFGITENNIIPLLDSLTQPAGVQTLKRGNVPKDILAILIKPPKLSLSHSSWVTMAFGKDILLFTRKYKLFMAVLIKFRKLKTKRSFVFLWISLKILNDCFYILL